MLLLMILLKFIFFNNTGYLLTLIELGVCGLLSLGLYIIFMFKMGYLNSVIDEVVLNKVRSKFKLKK